MIGPVAIPRSVPQKPESDVVGGTTQEVLGTPPAIIMQRKHTTTACKNCRDSKTKVRKAHVSYRKILDLRKGSAMGSDQFVEAAKKGRRLASIRSKMTRGST